MGEVSRMDFRKSLRDFQSLIPVLTVVITILGFIYLKAFYRVFGVDIDYYVNVNDLFFIPIVLLTTVFSYSIIFLLAFLPMIELLYPVLEKRYTLFGLGDKQLDKDDIEVFTLFLFVLVTFGLYLLVNDVNYIWPLYLLPVMMARIYVVFYKVRYGGANFRAYFVTVVLLIVGTFALAGNKKANTIDEFSSDNKYEFYIGNKFYSTFQGQYFFIGETSEYMFLYDMDSEATLIFQKSEMSEFRVTKVSMDFLEKHFRTKSRKAKQRI